MKKRLLSLALCLLLLLPLAACAAEQYDLLYETTVDTLTYRVRGSDFRAKQIIVKEGDAILWSQKIKVSASVGSLGGDYGLEILDLNFDGSMDLMIPTDIAGDEVFYLCWLWDAEKGKYVESEELTGLCNVATDPELKAIFAFSHFYEYEPSYEDAPANEKTVDSTTKYVWKDGVLTPAIRISISHDSSTDRYCYSVAYYDEKLGDFGDSDDKWLTSEEYESYDMSFLYYFK
ncbi:MAG: hypothetical protein IJF33_02765 [Clostridia bacterium]|nr:hypothetical protein [Clostridia bacterium]